MTVKELNALVESAYAAAFAFEDQLTRTYLIAFDRAAQQAEKRFRASTVTAAGFVPPPVDTLTSGMTEEEQAEANRLRDLAAKAVASALVVLGLGAIAASFMEAISQRGALNFEQELLLVLRNTVQRGINEGWTADETALALRDIFKGVSFTTAQMMAQTELTTLVNERSLQAAQKVAEGKAAPVYKVWQTMRDPRVRPAHAATEGQTVPIDQPFNVSGFSMMYPGDPSAPMRLVARCRCRMTYTETLTASAEEATLMSMTDTAANASSTTVIDTTNLPDPITAATIVVVDTGEEEEAENGAACPECGAMNDAMAQHCDQCGAMMGEAESETEDAGEPGEEEMAVEWRALLAIEGQRTEDGRLLDPGSITWRDLPMSLMAMDTTGPGGHEGAQVAGTITNIWRDGNEIWGEGYFSGEEFGCKVKRMVAEQSLRGNSIDLAVTAHEYRNADGAALDQEGVMEAMMSGEEITLAVTEGVIMASTVCPTPAIAGAEIMLASGVLHMTFIFSRPENDVLTAAGAGMAPLAPPLAWFEDPRFDGPTPLTVTADGQVKGHAALWNSCHIGEPHGPGICVPPPRSGMNYEIFHHGVVTTEEGVDIPCGQITMSTLHAGRDLSWKATLEHYENSGCAVADVVAGEDRYGIWVSGGLRPDLPAERVRELKAGSLSGDWRDVIGRGLEFLAALVVNIPGFPIPRPEARVVASAAGEEVVLALVAAGMVTDEDVQGMSRREYLRKIAVLTAEEEPFADGFAITAADRRRMAKNGQALPDGSFPIPNCDYAERAIRAQGRAKPGDRAKVRAHIRKRVAALGCSGDIFDNYK